MRNNFTETEYRNIKLREREVIETMLKELRASKDRRYMYRDKYPVTDLKDMLTQAAERYGDAPLFRQKDTPRDDYRDISFRQVLDDVNALGTALLDLGLGEGHIGLIGRNCAEWGETYLAVTGGVGVVVPLDRELKEQELAQLARKGDLTAVVTVSKKHYEIFRHLKESGVLELSYIITTSLESDEDPEAGLLSWHALLARGRALLAEGRTDYLKAQIFNTDPVAILFTSGTTGVAKGIMLSSKNLVLDTILCMTMLEARPTDVCFSVLPMHHAYECTATFLDCVYSGACMAFCSGLKYMRKELAEVKPTVMLAVPLIFESFYHRIQKELREQINNKLLRKIFLLEEGADPGRIRLPRQIRKRILAVFGGNIRTLISGGAAIEPYVLDFFCSLGLRAVQGYGLTECSPIIALNPDKPKYMRNQSAGHLLPFTECRILDSDDNGIGEICFRGPTVMLGYYQDPEHTAEAVDEEGWFRSGDLGYLDPDQYVYITGRRKNVILTGNGKNVFPEELESYLQAIPYIRECLVWCGNTDPSSPWNGICATLLLDEEALTGKLGPEHTDQEAEALLQAEVDRLNETLPRFKQIAHLIIRKREFTKTTSMKIQRFIEDNKRP